MSEEFYTYKGAGGEFQLPVGFKDEFNRRIKVEQDKVRDEFRSEMETMRSESQKLATELDKIRKSSMTEAERIEAERKEREQEIATLRTERDTAIKDRDLFRRHKIDSDIFQALSGYELYNPAQVNALLKSSGETDLVLDGNEYKTVFKTREGAIPLDDAVKSFLGKPENANLVKSGMQSGGGTRQSRAGGSSDGGTFKQSEIVKNPEVRKAYNEAIARGEVPQVVNE